ncbi:hypothetical protein FACS189447_04980 [Spirochaetia bacterium]|nr:hypothetical protein FACS189447_04980 [Spirochaetia bacterium]
MNIYTAKQINGLPDWNSIEEIKIDLPLWVTPPPGLKISAKLCYSPDKIHVRLQAVEKQILSRFSGLLDMVCLDSCLEFFFSPLEGHLHYFNFEFNPQGAMWLGYGSDRNHSIRQYIPKYRELFSVSPFTIEGGWGVEFSIPSSFICIYAPAFTLEKGKTIRGNFYKCGDETATPHYLVWNPIESKTPDYHKPEYFGKIILG